MLYYLSTISFIIYSLLVTVLFITSLISSFTTGHYLVSAFKVIVIIFLLYEIAVEWFVYHKPKKILFKEKVLSKNELYTFIAVFFGAVGSYLLNHNFQLGAVVASALIGILGAILIKKYAIPIYCGSFAGMVSSVLVEDLVLIILVALFSGILYTLGSETFKGFGGKLGATAYFGTLLGSFFYDTFAYTMTETYISIEHEVFIVFIVGALGTYLINKYLDTGAVLASALIGISGGLIQPNLMQSGSALAVALFCGTFIGMSKPAKLSSRLSVIIASLIGSTIYLYTASYFAGLGGKLGLIAFGSSVATAGFLNFRKSYKEKRLHQ